jgi:triple functional domain protein
LLQLADTLVETGHAHAPSIKSWVEEVDITYKDFSTRMDKYRIRLEVKLGIRGTEQSIAFTPTSPTTSASLKLDGSERHSDSSLESKLSKDSAYIGSSDAPSIHSSVAVSGSNKTSSNSSLNKPTSTLSPAPNSATDLKQLKQIQKLTEEKRKSTRRKEFIMSELLETERSYVKDLETAVNSFLKPMQQPGADRDKIPGPLRGKEHIIFGNVVEILGFHQQIFIKELEK